MFMMNPSETLDVTWLVRAWEWTRTLVFKIGYERVTLYG
jgi:hypothetical protein